MTISECYLKRIKLIENKPDYEYVLGQHRTCYNGIYPFNFFPDIFEDKEKRIIEFAPITIFYGDNGSGKTTLLNVIAEKAGVIRHSAFNSSAFFDDYVAGCEIECSHIPKTSQIITSDDVSDYLLNIRYLNDGIETRKNELFAEYLDRKYSDHKLRSLSEYDDWKETHDAKSKSQSTFVKERLMRNVDMHSNGETAMKYYVERINENALYLIDEPENSLSPKLQLELREYIIASSRYYNCQFVISTHSPFFLSLPNAKIIDLDEYPARERKWTELKNIRIYYDFFKENATKIESSITSDAKKEKK